MQPQTPFTPPQAAPTPPPLPTQPPLPPAPAKKTNPKLWIIIAVALITLTALVAVVLYIISISATNNSPSAETGSEVVTDYDNSKFTSEVASTLKNNSFDPATLIISSHTRVNWQNSDAASHWLTLNDPTQKDGPATAPENDPSLPTRTELASGGGYAHVFEKAGTYVLHLVDNPTANMTVVVK